MMADRIAAVAPVRLLLGQNATSNATSGTNEAVTNEAPYTPLEIKNICQRAEDLTSLTCECQTSQEYPQIVLIDCTGPDNFQEQLVFDHGQVSLENTCAEFSRQGSTTNQQDLVCVTEYYHDFDNGQGNKPWMCEAKINGNKCAFCSPHQQGSWASTCKDGLTLRCDGYGTGSLCTSADGSKRLSLPNFGTPSAGSSSSSDEAPVAYVVFVIFVAVILLVAKFASLAGGGSSSSSSSRERDYLVVEMSRRDVAVGKSRRGEIV